jgi:hypothetical protein
MKDFPGRKKSCPREKNRKRFLLRLPRSLFDITKSYADKENLSITWYINRALEAYIEATNEVDEDEKNPLSQPAGGWWIN